MASEERNENKNFHFVRAKTKYKVNTLYFLKTNGLLQWQKSEKKFLERKKQKNPQKGESLLVEGDNFPLTGFLDQSRRKRDSVFL